MKIMGNSAVIAATVASIVVLAINYGIAKGDNEHQVKENKEDIKELKVNQKKIGEDIRHIRETLIKIDSKVNQLSEEKKKKKGQNGQ